MSDDQTTHAPADADMGPTTCSLNRSWVVKTSVFLAVVLAFGVWAAVDAFYAYPKRGLADASVKLKDFLKAAGEADRLTATHLTVADPKAALADLEGRAEDLRRTAASSGPDKRTADMDLAKLEWLRSLSKVWKLDASDKPLGVARAEGQPDRALYFEPPRGQGYALVEGQKKDLSPRELATELAAYWNKTSSMPTELSAYDLPVQYLFMVAGLGWAAYLIFLLMRCRARARGFRWEPSSQRLTLPGGASFTPADLADVDKRKWHKFYATMVLTDGTRHEMDLLRYEPLEAWVLEMEATRFPERAEEARAAKAAEEAAAAEAAAEAERLAAGDGASDVQPAGADAEQQDGGRA